MWWTLLKQGRLHKFSREQILELHTKIVVEMLRRKMHHWPRNDLDRLTHKIIKERYGTLLLERSEELSETDKEIASKAREPSPYAPVHHYGKVYGRPIKIEEVLKAYEKPIVLKRPYVCLIGGIANWGESKGDIDLLIMDPYRDEQLHKPVEFRLGRALDPEIAHRATFNYGYFGGAFTSYVPLYDLVLVPSALRQHVRLAKLPRPLRDLEAEKEAAKSLEEDAIKPLRFFLPLKGWKGYYREADLVPLVVKEWFKPEDYPIAVQKKYDGVRMIVMKQGNKVVIRTEDGEDVTKRFPTIVNWAKKNLPHTVTLDCEVEMWVNGKHQPREFVAGYIHLHAPPDDRNFVFNTFDCLYFYDPSIEHHELRGTVGDLHKQPYELRLRYLDLCGIEQSTESIPDTPGFNITPTHVAKSPAELAKLIKKVANTPASEGAVIKSLKSDYPLNGLTRKWLKWKKMAEIHAIVLECIPTKTKGVYNLLLGLRIPAGWKVPKKYIREVNGKQYMVLCKTFNVAGYKKPGTIVTLSFHTLNHYINRRTDEQWVAAYEPRFIDVRKGQTVPDSAREAIEIAREKELLQVKYLEHLRLPMDDKLHDAVMQNHYRGRSVHMDFRIAIDHKYLEGFTIAHQRRGAIKEDVKTLKQAKEIERNWDKYFKMTNKPQTYILSPRRKLWVEIKKPEPIEWLDVEGVVPPGEVGATRYEYGVFSIVDKPKVFIGAVKPDFYELFLYGKKFNGRWVIRLLPNPWKSEMPRREFVWLMWKPEDQTPYVLTKRAVQKKWIPPRGISCLPPEIRRQIPPEYQYWKYADKQKRLEVRDALVEAIRKGEVRIKPIKMSSSTTVVVESSSQPSRLNTCSEVT